MYQFLITLITLIKTVTVTTNSLIEKNRQRTFVFLLHFTALWTVERCTCSSVVFHWFTSYFVHMAWNSSVISLYNFDFSQQLIVHGSVCILLQITEIVELFNEVILYLSVLWKKIIRMDSLKFIISRKAIDFSGRLDTSAILDLKL